MDSQLHCTCIYVHACTQAKHTLISFFCLNHIFTATTAAATAMLSIFRLFKWKKKKALQKHEWKSTVTSIWKRIVIQKSYCILQGTSKQFFLDWVATIHHANVNRHQNTSFAIWIGQMLIISTHTHETHSCFDYGKKYYFPMSARLSTSLSMCLCYAYACTCMCLCVG